MKKRYAYKNDNSFGRSIVEMLGILSIIAVLSIGGIDAYSKAMEKMVIDETLQQLHFITKNINSLFSQQHSYRGLNNRTAIQLMIVPQKMITSSKTIHHPSGGEVKIRAVSRGNGFVIVYNHLLRHVCAKIASEATNFGDGNLKYLMISPTGYDLPRSFPISLDNGEYRRSELPLTYDKAAADCSCPFDTCGIALFFQ